MSNEGVAYEPECADVAVAVRAILMLFRRGKWELLEDVGVRRKDMGMGCLPNGKVKQGTTEELLMEAVDLDTSFHTTDGLVALLRLCPFLRSAALEMVYRYLKLTYRSRRDFYAISQNGQKVGIPA